MKSVIDKKNGMTLFTGSLQACQNFIGMFDLHGLVVIVGEYESKEEGR